jgi:hypothetical protein
VQRHALIKQRFAARIVTLYAGDQAQVDEGGSNAPCVPRGAVERQALLVQHCRAPVLALHVRGHPQDEKRVGHAAPVAEILMQPLGFFAHLPWAGALAVYFLFHNQFPPDRRINTDDGVGTQ